MFKSIFAGPLEMSFFRWMGKFVFLLMFAVVLCSFFRVEIHSSVIVLATLLSTLLIVLWIGERIFLARYFRASRRVLSRLEWKAEPSDHLGNELRKVLTDEIAGEIVAVENINHDRARKLKKEFRQLHCDGQTLGLISKDEGWESYFKNATVPQQHRSTSKKGSWLDESSEEMELRV